jgi:ubiquinone/menaquinone biosynthesis C-methylase UbiE
VLLGRGIRGDRISFYCRQGIRLNDVKTAEAFAESWNNLPAGSVYTVDQFEDWMNPIEKKDVEGRDVLELGCGNGSILMHLPAWNPRKLVGVDLGSSVKSAQANLSSTGFSDFSIQQADLTEFSSAGFDLVYCIGVLHHLQDPQKGFHAVVRNTKVGAKFHCWVYAREGNGLIILFVDPIRKLASHLPWFITKFLIATPLAFIYFLYAHLIVSLRLSALPLYHYSRWITRRPFSFFRHVAFDQLVTPRTVYLDKKTIEGWLGSDARIRKDSTYVIFRNGNSWKFGGVRAS